MQKGHPDIAPVSVNLIRASKLGELLRSISFTAVTLHFIDPNSSLSCILPNLAAFAVSTRTAHPSRPVNLRSKLLLLDYSPQSTLPADGLDLHPCGSRAIFP